MGIARQEIRDLAISAYQAGEGAIAIARVLGKSVASVNRWLKHYRDTGSRAVTEQQA